MLYNEDKLLNGQTRKKDQRNKFIFCELRPDTSNNATCEFHMHLAHDFGMYI